MMSEIPLIIPFLILGFSLNENFFKVSRYENTTPDVNIKIGAVYPRNIYQLE